MVAVDVAIAIRTNALNSLSLQVFNHSEEVAKPEAGQEGAATEEKKEE